VKKRVGRRLILELRDVETGQDGPVAVGEFSSPFWAWVFQHLETRFPPREAEKTTFVGFENWDLAERYALRRNDENPR